MNQTPKIKRAKQPPPKLTIWLNPYSHEIMEQLHSCYEGARSRRAIFRDAIVQYAARKNFPPTKVYPTIGRRPAGTIALDVVAAKAFAEAKKKSGYSNNAVSQYALEEYLEKNGGEK